MPDENKPEIEETPVVEMFKTERNGIERAIVQDCKSRGENKGTPYLRPADITPDNIDEARQWLGDDMCCAILNAKMALMGSAITEQATNEDGVLNPDLAQKYFADFSTRGETKAELEEKKSALVKELTTVAIDPNLDTAAKCEKIGELGKQINNLEDAIASKSRERKSKTDKTAEEGSSE